MAKMGSTTVLQEGIDRRVVHGIDGGTDRRGQASITPVKFKKDWKLVRDESLPSGPG